MNKLRLGYLLIGILLFLYVLQHVSISEVLSYLVLMGWTVLLVLAIYFSAFLVDSLSWQLILGRFRFNFRGIYELWKIRMIGEAFNSATPLGSLGGEPVKAFILKRKHSIGYREAIASQILAKTTNLLGMLIFLTIGLIFVLGSELPVAYKASAITGLAVFSTAIILFFLVQRYKITSLTGTFFTPVKLKDKLNRFLKQVHGMEDKLIDFYAGHTGKFCLALFLSILNWHIGVLELYAIMYFLGTPVTLEMAYIIEAAVQLVRAAGFIIPSALGIQEGTFVLLISVITGDASLGLAVAFVRRFRELVWIIWGMLLGWQYTGQGKLIAMAREVEN